MGNRRKTWRRRAKSVHPEKAAKGAYKAKGEKERTKKFPKCAKRKNQKQINWRGSRRKNKQQRNQEAASGIKPTSQERKQKNERKIAEARGR